jgi:PKD repeat protein
MSSDSVVVNVEGIVYPISFNTNVQILNAPPFSFQFNNSTPNMNNYDFTWFFGDGSFLSSNNQNIFHTYDFNGLYTVSLVATGLSTGCTDTLVKNDYLYCTGGQEQVVPIAAFTGIPTSLNVGEFVSFSDNSINSPTTWLWDFPGGNPSSSTVKNPSNIQYNTPGTYDVTLIVSNIAGSDNLTKYGYIVVSNTGVEISNFSDNIQVYPNPVSNELIIEIKDNYEQINFEIINIIGQSIYKGSIVEKAIIQTSDFTPGVYLIKFENGEKFEFRKIVKE